MFAGIFPTESADYEGLRSSLAKLSLNDPSVNVEPDSSAALGQGWRAGFRGLLHLEIFIQRLEQEYNTSCLVTTPSVTYQGGRGGGGGCRLCGTTVPSVPPSCVEERWPSGEHPHTQ